MAAYRPKFLVQDLVALIAMEAGGAPTDQQREAALLASSVLLAAQRIATDPRERRAGEPPLQRLDQAGAELVAGRLAGA